MFVCFSLVHVYIHRLILLRGARLAKQLFVHFGKFPFAVETKGDYICLHRFGKFYATILCILQSNFLTSSSIKKENSLWAFVVFSDCDMECRQNKLQSTKLMSFVYAFHSLNIFDVACMWMKMVSRGGKLLKAN